jgi:arylsulfatase
MNTRRTTWSRRHFAAAGLLLAMLGACDAEQPPPPSILVIVVDSLHAGHVSSHGYARPTTPNFDRFAADGVQFLRAYSQSSWTLPSTASLFTGLTQEQHALRTFDDRLAADVPTVAERLKSAGYRTRAVVQTPVLASRHGLSRGFERYQLFDHSLESVERAVKLAREHWDEAADRPLFLYVHLAPPHMPYQPPAPFAARFGDEHPEVSGSVADCRHIHRAKLAPDAPQVRSLIARYDEHIAFADACVGRLLADFQRDARGRAAWIVWTSDHGEAFLQHGSQGHNATVYDEMLHVPLAFGALNTPLAPRRVNDVVSTLDVAPTVLALCGLPPLHDAGATLHATLLHGAALPERTLFFSSRYKADAAVLHCAVRRGDFKLAQLGPDGPLELYDLRADPEERSNLASARGELALELAELLARERGAARASEAHAAPLAADREQLAELGYGGD